MWPTNFDNSTLFLQKNWSMSNYAQKQKFSSQNNYGIIFWLFNAKDTSISVCNNKLHMQITSITKK